MISNCRCCGGSYIKSTNKNKLAENPTKNESCIYWADDYYCILPAYEEGKVKEPIGFCGMCDKNNPVEFNGRLRCHQSGAGKSI